MGSSESPQDDEPPPSHRRELRRSPSGASPQPRPPPQPPREPEHDLKPLDTIHYLMKNPVLCDPVRTPRYPIVLCHGLYGFDVLGPSAFPGLRLHYWSNVLSILKKKVGADVIVTSVPGTGSIASRSENLDRLLQEKARGRGVNLMAHSMGGLDCRHLITHVKPTEYTPLSLTTVSTPHRGSPFMDWCADNIGLGKLRQKELQDKLASAEIHSMRSQSSSTAPQAEKSDSHFSFSSLPSSFTTLLISVLDSPAYANLTSTYLNDVFNPATPDDPRVKYFSVTGRTDSVSVWHPFWLPKMVLDGSEEKVRDKLKRDWMSSGRELSQEKPPWETEEQWGNDGLVTVQSARWGEFLGIVDDCDHWEIRGASGIELNVDFPSVPLASIGANVGLDGWSIADWRKFAGAWRKQEKKEQGNDSHSVVREAVAPAGKLTKAEKDRIQEGERNDPVIKSSTDKLSAVFDWLADQPTKLSSKGKDSGDLALKKEKKLPRNDKVDLERFYMALSKKLYDEGL
ncbi:hypothetical protein SERLA73DRAFT_183099 [Serpula lacrymans var. lacrymans S7.3]|uniref:DUF676 domain-containing protein n=2 Tax=Serpula lacrymans var. lacrymans TaxID=341189 RepID=F8Q1L0_SERL3|nr:uncharacterized protein SERLADRAFT_470093 [Serpula lacrymans var. lacrymans S7.9]EGN98188.1 hypothetical protein SERLA73DRAFT_183099 [Serpula lacrymans var. lacrymans S7.3]EGO23765.1 hypothetical protein SERLADRAFT_470093 [Serpula lacrymans var. lacrymans S7.9]